MQSGFQKGGNVNFGYFPLQLGWHCIPAVKKKAFGGRIVHSSPVAVELAVVSLADVQRGFEASGIPAAACTGKLPVAGEIIDVAVLGAV